MDSSNRDSLTADDLSALAWVQDELRKSLDNAHKALRRFLKEAGSAAGSDVDAVDPSVLRTARQQIHQGVGALELVGMPAAASVLRASEAAIQRYIQKPQKLDAAAVETLEKASFGLLDYLSRVLAGRKVSAVSLFPQYRAVQELAGADRIHPADLWSADWHWTEVADAAAASPRSADAATRGELEALLLALMRGRATARTAQRMSDLCAGLGVSAPSMHAATFWRLAAAFFEAVAQGLLPLDVYSKRVASRILAQFGMIERGESAVSERLAQDLLFFCAQCRPGDAPAPRVQAVRRAYGLEDHEPVNYEVSQLGRFDPALLVQARKRVAAAKDAWSAVAGGEMHRLTGLNEQFSLVGDSLRKIYPAGEALAEALMHSVAQTVESASAPPAPLAMEVATSVLYLEASLEDADFDDPQLAERSNRLAERIESVRRGEPAQPLESWMEDLYRRVSDRQTMGSVVQELRASLAEAEKQIDQYFRNPADRSALAPVPGQLAAMRGVLSVLGMDQASQAVLRMRDVVDELLATEVDPQSPSAAATFERLAGNLGALGFLIDMLSYQPQMAKSLFTFDAQRGELRPVMGRSTEPPAPPVTLVEPRLIEQAQALAAQVEREDLSLEDLSAQLRSLSDQAVVADQPALAEPLSQAQSAVEQAARGEADLETVREQVVQAVADFVSTASDAATLAPEPAAAPVAAPATPGPSGLEDDDEMRAIFLEEAQEVMGTAGAALDLLTRSPDDIEQLTTVRRAFHTLKGSSRMVGLHDFGEAAWACEQLYNTWLADQKPASEDLLSFTGEVLDYLAAWIGEIAARVDHPTHHSAPVRAAADAMRLEGRRLAVHAPGGPTAVSMPAELPAAEPPVPAAPGVELPAFTLDLSAFEDAAAAVASAEPVFAEPPLAGLEDPMPVAEPAAPAEVSVDFGGIDLDLGAAETIEAAAAPPDEVLPPAFAPAERQEAPPVPQASPSEPVNDQVKVVGHLRIGIPLFNIYLTEADELSRRLSTELAEWALELDRPVGEAAIAHAHSLAGSSSTVGFTDLSQLARRLEHALMRSQAIGRGDADEARLFVDVADEIRRLLHQFAAGFLKEPSPELLARLAEYELHSAHALESLHAGSDLEDSVPGQLPTTQPAADVRAAAGSEAQVASPVEGEPTEPAPLASPASMLGSLPDLGRTELRELPALQAITSGATHVTGLPGEGLDIDDDIDAVDAVDADLFPIFEEEAQELLPQLASELREWLRQPGDARAGQACMRTLHTFKGGARLAGAMRLGELAHRLETSIERLLARGDVSAEDVEPLEGRVDVITAVFEALRRQDAQAYADATAAVQARPQEAAVLEAPSSPLPLMEHVDLPVADGPSDPPAQPDVAPVADSDAPAADATASVDEPDIDWSRFVRAASGAGAVQTSVARAAAPTGQAAVRVRAQLLDRLVNQAGEVSITRARLESEVSQIKGSLSDLTDNLERLRQQLRDIELQAETQMASRMEQAKAEGLAFDPLEFDRFTRFQEITRMMAESVNDVATVQRALQRTLETTEDELAAQARLTRELQDDLLRTRMVEFEGLSERLYRVVRLAAKETGKQVRLDIVGGAIEVDRGVLDRMTASFEHLLRNCVTHGIELPQERAAAGKDPVGTIVVALHQEGNEVAIEFRDDGAGLNLARIRERGLAMGLIAPDENPSDADLANLIFTPGFSTAETVTELAGRGVGMDVVRSDVNAMGGRIETATAPGQGTSFKLVLPLTTAVTQIVMLRCGDVTVGVPANLIEIVRRASPEEVRRAYETSVYLLGEQMLPFFWLGALLQSSGRGQESGRTLPVVVVRSAQQRVALHVDEVLGTQEVVVKNLGPQLSRLPGLAGMTLLASGAVALIYNPVALATVYGEAARALTAAAMQPAAEAQRQAEAAERRRAAAQEPATPLVLVVDDSLTVRRVTQRLLAREGYRVALAKDGLEALERLAEERPAVVLSDIEMPRMDGFDLVRNLRADARLADLPVIMITSRIAQKHRDYAVELGVNHYLGKPYSEEELLALIGRYVAQAAAAQPVH
ncbi:MAG: Hpt domain-containing protein [Caldimonas sp.]|uniref:hybrid sensor histidine kinase/response regulator n=1 Tax=Caldimonas sp. TaxID=2838790 RepID=UPI00391B9FBE